MTPRSLWLLLGFSATIHSMAVLPFWNGWPRETAQEPILISYVSYPRAAAPRVAPDWTPAKAAKSVPKPVSPEPVFAAPPVLKLPERPKSPAARTSAELLSDPQLGKVFSSYFQAVRDRIHQKVRRKYTRENVGNGTVSLFFILNPDGRLEQASVVEAQSRAGESVRGFAVQCLKEASPFPPFPAVLHSKNISFQVTVLFEEI